MQVPRIISSPALSIVGLAINTTPGSPEIGQLWKTYFATPNKNFTRAEPGVSYGVMQLDRSRGVLRYLAGESSLDNPSDLEVWQIPASKYAIFQADLNSVSDVFTYIYAQWLPQSGYTRADGPDFERYDADFPNNPNFEIWLPIFFDDAIKGHSS